MRERIEHVLVHVRDALATDARVGELGLEVACEGDAVVVRGRVSTPERQRAVTDVTRGVLHDHGCDRPVHDATTVTTVPSPHDALDDTPEQL